MADLVNGKSTRDVLVAGNILDVSVASGTVGVHIHDVEIRETLAARKVFGPFTKDVRFTLSPVGAVATYDNTTSTKYMNEGVLQPYWGPITGRSSIPKAAGTWCWLYGEREYVINSRVNKIGLVYSFISGRGEKMKNLGGGTQNGYGQVYASLEVVNGDGTVYPAYYNGSRIGQCDYGDVIEMSVQLDRYLPAGTRVRVKNRVFQQAHNDAGATNPNQFMIYFQYRRGAEYFYRADTNLSAANQANWATMVDTPGSSNGVCLGSSNTNSTGIVGGTLGFVPHNLVGYTTIPSFWCFGDSRIHGSSDDGSTANVDYGLDAYGVSGLACRTLGRKYGVHNVGHISEQFADVQTVSNIAGRRKLEAYCSHRAFFMGINDFGSGGDFNGVAEDSIVSQYITSKARVESLLLTGKKPTVVSTIYANTTSTDFYITTTNQSISNGTPLRALNAAIRRCLVANDSYLSGGDGITTGIDTFIVKTLPNARSVNTGTGTITVNAAGGGVPANTTYVHSTSIFTADDNNRNIVIAAAGSSAGNLKAQMKYISGTTVRLIQRGSNGNEVPIAASQLNGGSSPLATVALTNVLYIQAEPYVTGIHATFDGEEEMAQYDIKQGLVNF